MLIKSKRRLRNIRASINGIRHQLKDIIQFNDTTGALSEDECTQLEKVHDHLSSAAGVMSDIPYLKNEEE